eukprot:c28668_g1_i1 orf=209-3130(+)
MRGRARDSDSRGGQVAGVFRDSRYPSSSQREKKMHRDGSRHDWHNDPSPVRWRTGSPTRREQDRLEADSYSPRSRPRNSSRGGEALEAFIEREKGLLKDRMLQSTPMRAQTRGRSQSPPRDPSRVPLAQSDYPSGRLLGMNNPAPLGNDRNDQFSSRIPPSFNPTLAVGGGGGGVPAPGVESLGTLVPHSLVLDDGSIRTYFTLPPEQVSYPLHPGVDGVAAAANGENATYPQTLSMHGKESGYPRGDGYRFGLDGPVDTAFLHGNLPGEKPFRERDGLGLDLHAHRNKPHSPYREMMPPPPRRDSRSPPPEARPHKFSSPGRERIIRDKMQHRYSLYVAQREGLANRFGLDSSRTDFVEGPGHAYRDGGPGSPSMLDPRLTGPPREREDRMAYRQTPLPVAPHRLLPDTYERDGPIMVPREAPSLNFPRNGPAGPQRDSRLVPYMEDHMYGEAPGRIMRHERSPRREDLPGEAFLSRRGPVHRSDMEGYVSPRRAAYLEHNRGLPISPRMRSHEPPLEDFHGDRGSLKRKYMEPSEQIPQFGQRDFTDDQEFKRKQRQINPEGPYDDYPGQRYGRKHSPGSVREFRETRLYHLHRQDFENRLWGGRDDLPLKSGRRSSYHPNDIEGVNHNAFSDCYCGDAEHIQGRPPRVSKFSSPHKEADFFHNDEHIYDRSHRSSKFSSAHEEGVFQEDDRQALPPDLPEDSDEFKQQLNRAFLKFSKVLNENSEQRKKYEEEGKAGPLFCFVCGRMSKRFMDTHCLLMHAYNCGKRGLRAEHLGLHKALCVLMGWSSAKEPGNNKLYQKISPEEAHANKEDLILWPPVVIIQNGYSGKLSSHQQEGIGYPEVDRLLAELGQANGKAKMVCGRQRHVGTLVLKYSPTFSGLKEAEQLHTHFETGDHGRKCWLQQLGNDVEGPDFVQTDAKTKVKRRVLYGYLALVGDLDEVDVETWRRSLVRSRKEIEAIADKSLPDREA